MILCDKDIKHYIKLGEIVIDPYVKSHVQPASYDVCLSNAFQVFRNYNQDIIDPQEDQRQSMERIEIDEDSSFVIHPGEFVLGSTQEKLTLPNYIVSRLEGKSSLGRLGLIVHCTAGYIDPGWTEGQITLELSNAANLPIRLRPGMKIGQLSFAKMTGPAEVPYGDPRLNSKYQGQQGPTISLMHKNYEVHKNYEMHENYENIP